MSIQEAAQAVENAFRNISIIATDILMQGIDKIYENIEGQQDNTECCEARQQDNETNEQITVVVKIPTYLYKYIKSIPCHTMLEEIVIDGMRIPKRHGNLKDESDIIADIYDHFMSCDMKIYDKSALKCMELIKKSPTIIEADSNTNPMC